MRTLLRLAALLTAAALPSLALAAGPGETLFNDNCSACHMRTGHGVPGAFPALAGDRFVTGAPQQVATTVLNGRGGMPAFKSELSDAQLSAILTYIRGAWGNRAGPVTPADMARFRTAASAPSKPKSLQAH